MEAIEQQIKDYEEVLDDLKKTIGGKFPYAILHIYHTVGIEGNTFEKGETFDCLRSGLVCERRSMEEHNELLGMKDAFRLLKDNRRHILVGWLQDSSIWIWHGKF